MAIAKVAEEAINFEEEYRQLEPQAERHELPLFPGTRVVYLGGNRKKSVAIPGSVAIERAQDDDGKWQDTRAAIEAGITSYDFATHDTRGRLIHGRLMPDQAPPSVRGRPFHVVEHPLHLSWFLRAKNANKETEFRVLPRREHASALEAFVRRENERRRRREQNLVDTMTA